MNTEMFNFIVEAAISKVLIKSTARRSFAKVILGDQSAEVDWEGIAMDLDLIKQQYEIVFSDAGIMSMLYWPSYEEGLANVITQMALTQVPPEASFRDVVKATDNVNIKDYVITKGKGRWCYWSEDIVIFYSSFDEIAKTWLNADTIEPDPDKTRDLMNKVGIDKVSHAAKMHASNKNSDPYETLEDFILSIK